MRAHSRALQIVITLQIKCIHTLWVRYTFDLAKQAVNVAKHGVFFTAAEDFEWASAQVQVDQRRSYGETRFVALGLIRQRVHVLVFNLRETSVRIISLRRANRREVKRYADHF